LTINPKESADQIETKEMRDILKESINVGSRKSEMSKKEELIQRFLNLTTDQWKVFSEIVKTDKKLKWILLMDEV
jgi:hypothetical protein